jgi:5-(carboxyamino)imidazole ribonucleotide synthase
MFDILRPAARAGTVEPLGNRRVGVAGSEHHLRELAGAGALLGIEVVALAPLRSSAPCDTRSGSAEPERVAEDRLRQARQATAVAAVPGYVSPEEATRWEDAGAAVVPSALVLEVTGDRLATSERLAAAGFDVVPRHRADAVPPVRELTWGSPLRSRSRFRHGPVGASAPGSGGRPGGAPESLVLEPAYRAAGILLAVGVRGRGGQWCGYPVLEERPQGGPVPVAGGASPGVSPDLGSRAAGLARAMADRLGAVGLFGARLFLTRAGAVLVDELFSVDHPCVDTLSLLCSSSPWENHLRAALDLPMTEPGTPADGARGTPRRSGGRDGAHPTAAPRVSTGSGG